MKLYILLISENTFIEVAKYGVYGRERRKKKTKFIFPSKNRTGKSIGFHFSFVLSTKMKSSKANFLT